MHPIAEIEAFVREEMASAEDHDFAIGHGFLHVDRVRRHALAVAEGEGFTQLDLAEATALLHDVGLPRVQDRREHATASAEVAADFLVGRGLYSEEETAAIIRAIAHHSDVTPIPPLRGAGLADALTAVLREADVLDALGAVGLMRAFTTKSRRPPYDPVEPRGGSWGLSADDFTELRRVGQFPAATALDQVNLQIAICDNLRSETARRIGAPLVAVMRAFVEQLAREVG